MGKHLKPSETTGPNWEEEQEYPAEDRQQEQEEVPPARQRGSRPVQPQQTRRPQQPPRRPPPQQTRPRTAPAEQPWRQEQAQGQRRPAREVEVTPPAYRRRKRRFFSKRNLPLILLVAVLVTGVLVAGVKLGSILLDYHRDRSAYRNLADMFTAGLAEPDVTTAPGETPAPEEDQGPSEVPLQIKWDELKSANSDVVGWLYCPDTIINYPVMQTNDNDFYLHRGFDKQPNTSGTLFADPVSTLGVLHSNFIIYGHNMKDGSMFASLQKYVDGTYYAQHPSMYFLTPQGNYRVDLIAGHIVESTANNYPGYFTTDEDYQTYLNSLTSSSFFGTNADVSVQYQLITLSTCDYSANYNDPRFLVHGLLVPIQ